MQPATLYKAIPVPVAPSPSSPESRATLLANRRRDTRPELVLRRELFRLGMRFLVDVSAPGTSRRRRVDVLLRGSRLAVLVHGCFWHCCPEHFHMPKNNREWWTTKFESIKHRDADTERMLLGAGWTPVVVWEHEDPVVAAQRIRRLDAVGRARRT